MLKRTLVLAALVLSAGTATTGGGIPPSQVVARVGRFVITAKDLLEGFP